MSDIDSREANLPKWARDKLTVLRMRLAEARSAANAGLSPDNRRTNVWLQKLNDGLPGYLPSAHHIARFYVGSSPYDWIEVGVRDPLWGVEIRAHDELHIQPSSSNVIYAKPLRTMLGEPPKHLRPYLGAKP